MRRRTWGRCRRRARTSRSLHARDCAARPRCRTSRAPSPSHEHRRRASTPTSPKREPRQELKTAWFPTSQTIASASVRAQALYRSEIYRNRASHVPERLPGVLPSNTGSGAQLAVAARPAHFRTWAAFSGSVRNCTEWHPMTLDQPAALSLLENLPRTDLLARLQASDPELMETAERGAAQASIV